MFFFKIIAKQVKVSHFISLFYLNIIILILIKNTELWWDLFFIIMVYDERKQML